MSQSFKENFLEGMCQVLQIMPEPPKNPVSDISDKESIRLDFINVGNDIRTAIDKVNKEYGWE